MVIVVFRIIIIMLWSNMLISRADLDFLYAISLNVLNSILSDKIMDPNTVS